MIRDTWSSILTCLVCLFRIINVGTYSLIGNWNTNKVGGIPKLSSKGPISAHQSYKFTTYHDLSLNDRSKPILLKGHNKIKFFEYHCYKFLMQRLVKLTINIFSNLLFLWSVRDSTYVPLLRIRKIIKIIAYKNQINLIT